MNFPVTVSARVRNETKNLIEKRGISPRLVFERGIHELLSDEDKCWLDIENKKAQLREARAEVIVLEMELDELKCKHERLHSDEEPVENNMC